MEFFIKLYFILMLICLALRGILFANREEKWYKTLIPGYNKYVLGKLADSKKLGLATCITNTLFHTIFLVYLIITVIMIDKGTAIISGNQLYMAENGVLLSILQYAWLGMALLSWISWAWLMRNFSVKQKASSWWLFMWAICPTLAYIYFACIRKTIYISSKGLVEKEVSYRKVK